MKKNYRPVEIDIAFMENNWIVLSTPDLDIGDKDYGFDDSPL